MCFAGRAASRYSFVMHLNANLTVRACTFVASLVAGCAHASPAEGKPCTLPIEVALRATPRLNPDAQGAALPTVVRLYQLGASERIEQADFAALWEHASDTLAGDLLAARELTLFPGRAQGVQVALRPDVRFLAAVAIVRQPSGSSWRALLPLPESSRMCAAYAAHGAPSPAVQFVFDGYRSEGSSRLLQARDGHVLPTDVAPEAQ
jgi:type VI secretion system protein VasD